MSPSKQLRLYFHVSKNCYSNNFVLQALPENGQQGPILEQPHFPPTHIWGSVLSLRLFPSGWIQPGNVRRAVNLLQSTCNLGLAGYSANHQTTLHRATFHAKVRSMAFVSSSWWLRVCCYCCCPWPGRWEGDAPLSSKLWGGISIGDWRIREPPKL